MAKSTKVVVIDDSAFFRKLLTLMLQSDPEIQVVATAVNGEDGLEKIRQFNPDIVTLDIEMPGINGLTVLKIIMEKMPLPVIMVSSLTRDGAQATIEALGAGAVDFIPKNLSITSMDANRMKNDLVSKIKHFAGKMAGNRRIYTRSNPNIQPEPYLKRKFEPRIYPVKTRPFAAVVIGVSTGGPYALMQMIPSLPENLPFGIAIAQHMPAFFTKSLAERLDKFSSLPVKEAEDRELFKPGVVYIAPGGNHLTFARDGKQITLKVSDTPNDTIYRPSVDLMMQSASVTFSEPLLGVIMTGMGEDGVRGLAAIRKRGGYVLAQDQESCVVFGMPKEAIANNLVDQVLPLSGLSSAIVSLLTETVQTGNHSPLYVRLNR